LTVNDILPAGQLVDLVQKLALCIGRWRDVCGDLSRFADA